MPNHDADFWNQACRVCNKLVKRYISHPDLGLSDIGYVPTKSEGVETIAPRINIKESWLLAELES